MNRKSHEITSSFVKSKTKKKTKQRKDVKDSENSVTVLLPSSYFTYDENIAELHSMLCLCF